MSEQPCENCGKPVGDARVCYPCGLSMERALGDVAWVDAELDVVLMRQTAKVQGGYVTGNAETPLPYDPRATEARWVLANTVTTWARVVEEESPSARIPLSSLGMVAAWLSTYAEWLRHHEAAGEAVAEILSAVDAAKRLVDVRPERWYCGPCGGVDGEPCGHDLYVAPGKPSITCPACGAKYDTSARRDWLLEAAHDHLATATEVTALLWVMLGKDVNKDMINGYVRRGKLSAHGSRTDGHVTSALYRIGDVIAAATVVKFDSREQRATKKAGQSA